MGSCSLLQGVFPTQGLNPGLPHCRWILYQLSHQGSPRILEWVGYLLSSGSSRPRNWTGISCIAGGFFTSWAIREAPFEVKAASFLRCPCAQRGLCFPSVSVALMLMRMLTQGSHVEFCWCRKYAFHAQAGLSFQWPCYWEPIGGGLWVFPLLAGEG